jgi:hypothetical protein
LTHASASVRNAAWHVPTITVAVAISHHHVDTPAGQVHMRRQMIFLAQFDAILPIAKTVFGRHRNMIWNKFL